jgi:hypothetical protein
VAVEMLLAGHGTTACHHCCGEQGDREQSLQGGAVNWPNCREFNPSCLPSVGVYAHGGWIPEGVLASSTDVSGPGPRPLHSEGRVRIAPFGQSAHAADATEPALSPLGI